MVMIKFSGVVDFVLVKKGYIWVLDVLVYWIFKLVDCNKIYVEFMGYGYFGGIILVWIVNMVVIDVLKKMF